MVAIGIATITVPIATSKLLTILLPKFHGCAKTVERFSSVGVNTNAVASEYTSRGVLNAVSKIQKMGSKIVPAMRRTPTPCKNSKLHRRASMVLGEGILTGKWFIFESPVAGRTWRLLIRSRSEYRPLQRHIPGRSIRKRCCRRSRRGFVSRCLALRYSM